MHVENALLLQFCGASMKLFKLQQAGDLFCFFRLAWSQDLFEQNEIHI